MPDDILHDALARATDTVTASMGRGVLASAGKLITAHLGPGPLEVVANENTFAVAGEVVQESLHDSRAAVAGPLVLPDRPVLYAAQDNAGRIRDSLGDTVPAAVGAGTLNDLMKLAAFELGRDYACVGTAMSMNGYTDSGAPMNSQGVKVTCACEAPAVIVMDLDVVTVASAYLAASGHSNLTTKIPDGADWILASATGVKPIDPDVQRLVQSGVATALPDPNALAARQPGTFRDPVERLYLSRLAMQAYGGTHPTSRVEHYFNHLQELAYLGADLEVPLSHGTKVAVGSLAMCAFYEALIGQDLSGIDADAIAAQRTPRPGIEASIRNRPEGAPADHVVREARSKYLTETESADWLRPLIAEQPEVTERLRAQLVPAGVLADRLHRAGAPSHPEGIGVTHEDVRVLFPRVIYYRSRYMTLDVAWGLDLFEDLMTEVFEKTWI